MMGDNFSDILVELCEKKTLEVDYVKGWLFRRLNAGKMDNLDYIECLNALNEYDRNNKTRTEPI